MQSHAADEQLADGGSRKHAVGDGRRKKKVGKGGKRVTEIEQENLVRVWEVQRFCSWRDELRPLDSDQGLRSLTALIGLWVSVAYKRK